MPCKPGVIWEYVLVTDASPAALPAEQLLVACLCAAWCHVCGDYRSRFDQVEISIKAHYPRVQFIWLDVEDEADLLHPLDVDDFPTLLIARGDAPLFFGPLTPQAQTLERMVRNAAQAALHPALTDPLLTQAVLRIRASL